MRFKLNFDYSAIAVLFWLYYCAICSFVSTFLLDRGFTNYRIGLVLTAANLISFFVQPFLADLSDHSEVFHVHRVFEILTVVLLGAACVLAVPTLGQSALFITFITAISLSMCLQTSLNALVFRLEEGGHTINFGACRSMGSLFYALFSLVAGFAVNAFGVEVLPLFGIVFAILLFGMLVLSERHLNIAKRELAAEVGERKAEKKEEEPERITISQFVRNNPVYMVFCGGMFLMFAGNGVMNGYMYQVIVAVGGTAREMGIAFAIATAVEVPVLFFFSKIQARFTMVQVLRVSAVGYIIRLTILALAKNVATIYVAMLFDMICFGLLMPGIVIFINEIMAKGEAVKGQATYVMMSAFGNVVASFFGGLILDIASVKLLLWLSTAVCTVGALVIIFVIGKVPSHREKETI